MSQAKDAREDREALPLISKRDFPTSLLLILLALLLYFPALGSRDLWAPVEPRYAEIARIMLGKAQWAVPTVNGDLYTDKPILYFWLVLLGSQLAGSVNEWTMRLPSALSALGLVLTTYFLGRDLFSPRVGLLAAIILGTSARVLWEGRWAHTDMVFTFLLALSLHLFFRAVLRRGRPQEFFLAYALMALATLTKGLIGIALPGMVVLAFVALRREWRAILAWRVPSGLLVFVLVAAPWFLWISLATEGQWLKEFIFTHHIQRYTSGFGHRQPFYYYLLTFPADFLPWTVFLAPALWACRSSLRALKEPGALFLFLWFFVIFLFFSASDTKRDLYLLPVFPPAAIFTARYFDKLMDQAISQEILYRGLAHLFFNLLWVGTLAFPVLAWFYRREMFWISLPFAIVTVAGALATVVSIRRKRPAAVFFSTALTVFLGTLCASVWILPFLDAYKSPKPFAYRVKQIVPAAQPLYIYADTMNDFNFYTEREIIPILSSREEIGKVISQEGNAYILVRDRDLDRLALQEKGKILAADQVGGKKWFLVVVVGA